jgi:hypothetical protein
VGPEIERSTVAGQGPKLRVVFTVERDDALVTITCTSPECIATLLRHGWRLVDSSQSDALMEALAGVEVHPTLKEATGEHRRRLRTHTAA